MQCFIRLDVGDNPDHGADRLQEFLKTFYHCDIGTVLPILQGTEEVGDEYLFFQPFDFGADVDPGIF